MSQESSARFPWVAESIGPKGKSGFLTAVLATLVLVVTVAPAQAAVIQVDTFDDETAVEPDNGACSLREAVTAANTDSAIDSCPAGLGADEIRLAAGTYALEIAGPAEFDNANGSIDVRSPMTLRGIGGKARINSLVADRVMVVAQTGPPGPVVLRNLSIEGGEQGIGAGLYVSGVEPVEVVDSWIAGNVADLHGGGVYNANPDLTLRRVLVSGNEADPSGLNGGLGAGIANFIAGVTIVDSEITGNEVAEDGGGIAIFDDATEKPSSMTLRRSSVRFNDAGADGPNILLAGPDVSALIERSTISKAKTGARGGGVFLAQGSATILNSTISSNTVSGAGGGVFSTQGAGLMVESTTIADNSAGVNGGGVSASNLGTIDLSSSIVGDNAAPANPDCAGGLVGSSGFNLIEQIGGTCGVAPLASDHTGADPRLLALRDNGGPTATHAIKRSSPAVNNGDPSGPPIDQRGVPRNPDIGAYELARCGGRVVNMVGTPGSDRVQGTAKADVFLGLGGNDRFSGGAGRDRACGGPGRDKLRGGADNDKLFGEAGNDVLSGGAGKRDLCHGGPGKDRAGPSCERRKAI